MLDSTYYLCFGIRQAAVIIIGQASQVDVPFHAGLERDTRHLFAKPPQIVNRQPHHGAGLFDAGDLRQDNRLHFKVCAFCAFGL